MSIEAELRTELSSLQSQFQAVGSAVETMDQKLDKALTNAGGRARQAKGEFKDSGDLIEGLGGRIERSWDKAGNNLLKTATAWIGGISLVGMAIDEVRNKLESAKRLQEETAKAAEAFSSGTRAGGDVPGMRKVIHEAAPTLSPDEAKDALQAYRKAGGKMTQEDVRAAFKLTENGQVLGWNPTETARSAALLQKAKVPNPQDVIAYTNTSGDDLSSLKPYKLRSLGARNAGAYDTAISTTSLDPVDVDQLKLHRVRSAKQWAMVTKPDALKPEIKQADDELRAVGGAGKDTSAREDINRARASAGDMDGLRREARAQLERQALFKWLVTDSAVEKTANTYREARLSLPEFQQGAADEARNRVQRVFIVNPPQAPVNQ